MNDIVERLSGLYDEWNSPHSSPDGLPTGASIMLDAADEITRLRAENERLRAALLPFASIKADDGDGFSGLPDTVIVRIEASVRELKAARAAMGEK